MRVLGIVLLAGLVLVAPLRVAKADGPSAASLLEMLRYDPESPTARLVLERLAALGEPGWKALASVVSRYPDDAGGLDVRAARLLVAGSEPKRLNQAGRAYDNGGGDEARRLLAVRLADAYPWGAERLHAHLRRSATGSRDLLRMLALRGLPREEIEAALAHGELKSLARALLDGHELGPRTVEILDQARSVAPLGLDPRRTRAFATEFAADPYLPLLRALAEVLREEDEALRTGAHCLLLTLSGLDIACDPALWHSWIDSRGETYTPPDPVSRGVVAAAVARAVRYVRQDLLTDGTTRQAYNNLAASTSGSTALSVFALLASGVPVADEAVRKAVETTLLVFDRGGQPGLRPFSRSVETYTLALMAMALGKLDAEAHAAPLAALRDRLVPGMLDNGQWTYASKTATEGGRPATGDNSNTQFANLGLRALRASGIPIDPPVWDRVDAHWRNTQHGDGAWGYKVSGRDARKHVLQMTASGIAGLAIAAEGRHGAEAVLRIAADASIKKGLGFLGRTLMLVGLDRSIPYSFYAVERACVLTGTRRFSGGGRVFDWYREGAWRLLERQNEDGSWGHSSIRHWESQGFGKAPSTAFALLFLTRATATIGEGVGVGAGTVAVSLSADEAAALPPHRAPPVGTAVPPTRPWEEAPAESAPRVTVEVDDPLLVTRAGRVIVGGTVTGPWRQVTVGGAPVQPDEQGRFSIKLDVADSGAIEVLATGPGEQEFGASVHVEIDHTPPRIELVGSPIRPVGKQRLRLEANEHLDGVRVGGHYFPADGRKVLVTVELGEAMRQFVVQAYDRASNKTRAACPIEVKNRVLVLDGKSAIRSVVPVKPEIFTFELWARATDPARRTALAGDVEGPGFGLFTAANRGTQPEALIYNGKEHVRAIGGRPLKPGRWTHLAMTYDGSWLRLWVDGRLKGETEAPVYKRSKKAIFIGAEAARGSRWGTSFSGAIDEVRLSDIVRYTSSFQPAFSHFEDRHTVLLYHFDTDTETAIFDASGKQHNGTPAGTPKIAEEKR